MSSAKNSSGRCLWRNAPTINLPEGNENELEIPPNVLPLLNPSPRAPLTTIQDPLLSPRCPPNYSRDLRPKLNLVHHADIKAETSEACGQISNFRGLASPGEVRGKSHSELSSAHSTPARTVSRVSRGGGFPKVSKATVNLPSLLPVQVPHFELDEDPSFWMDHNVQVLIRIRPISNTEKVSEGDSRCLRQDSAQSLTWLGHPETRFTFDHVACETLSQGKLFKAVGLPMVENCMSGYNSCMFAYGQTGSGKTYTMMGSISLMDKHPRDDCGMTPRIFQYLFTRIREEEDVRKDEKLKYNCKCSFLEIYNEQITDLLEPSSTNLQLREDQKKGVYVENLMEFEVTNAEDVIELLIQGAANRKMASTHMNCESSRSHSVFTCVIESRWEKDSMTHFRFGRLNLVDLAGSERQKSSGAEGEKLKEAANINKSLSTLGLVIMTLVDVAHGKHRHVPYRDSRLTFLLQDSLGGNSKTTIIANVSPSICSANETLSTLKFAQRAKLIQNNAKVNEDASGDVIALQQQIQKLKDQVNYLLQNQKVKMLLPTSVKFNSPDIHEENNIFPTETVLTSCNYIDAPWNRTKYLETTLVGALRREKIAEAAVKSLEAEIEHLNHLLQWREEDDEHTKLMLRTCEDKIKKMDGLLCAEEYFWEDNIAIKEDTNLLQRKIDRNPELTQIALENIRLSEKLRKFQGYHERGEREILMAEVSALRDQLLDVCEGHHSLVNIHGRQTTQDEVQVPLSTYEEAKAMHEEADDLLKESKDCSNEKLTRKADSLYCQLKNCFDSKQDIIQVEDAHCEPSQCATNRKDGLQTADAIVDALGELAALEQEHESERSAAGCSWLLKTENVQLKHRLDELHHENSILKKAISAKDTEIIAVNKEWEQAILNLTSYLLDGSQLLQDSSDQIKDILAFFSQRSSIGQQVEAAVEIFIKNENTISCLLRSLEDAQKEAMEMEFKLSSLKGATVSITDFYELEDCESAEQVMELRKLLMEEFSAIQDLDNEVRNLDSVVIEPPRRSDVAFMGMNNVNRKNVPKSSTEEYEEMLLCSPRSNSEEMVKQANILLVKFEEAQETMKEADTMLNELMRVNETTKCEVDRWKQAFEELTIERTVLIEEVKQLKDSSGQHLNDLKEIEELVQTIERSFLQLRNDVDETVKLISCDGYSIWGEFKSSIDDIKLWFEDIWFINMEKQLVSLVLYHSIVEAYEDSSTHTNRQARFILSYGKGGTCVDKANRRADFSLNQNDLLKEIAEFEKDMSDTAPNSVFPVRNENIGIRYVMQPSLHLEESPPLDPSSSKIFKRLGLISHKIENNISSVCQTAGTDAFPENMLLKELNRKNLLLQGLLFDIRLLQESMSNASDIKDEAYAMKTSLCKAQHELEAKTAELDNISINFRNLEASLTDIETALSTSNSELDLANEKIRLLADENSKLKFLLDDLYIDKGDLEKQLEEKKGVVIELENEILQMSDRIDERILFSTEDIEKRLLQMREERDRLQADIYFVNDKLQASNALANEYEAIAAEARQLSETSKVYAEQKEEEVKILERSVEELEYTVTLLERKVYEMGEEVKSHHVMREGLELELEALRRRIQPVDGYTESVDTEFYNAGRSIENEIPRKNDETVDERFEIERRIVILEAEKLNQAQEIEQYKDYIAELVLLADAQASEYQKKYMSLETLVCEAKTDSSTSVSTTSMSNKIESSVRARGSGSPFRCIAGLVQQVNSEKDRELSVARSRIEELEAMALNWQKEVCVLKARLAATENMTYDVIRDLLGLKLDVTNYANLVDQCQLQMLAEVQAVDKPNSEQENLELREQITDFAKERKCWIEEIAKQQGKIQAAQAAFMQLQQQKQFLTAQNEMLKMDKATLKRKIAELNEIVRVLKESQGVL